jgi:triacylglycerol lipase
MPLKRPLAVLVLALLSMIAPVADAAAQQQIPILFVHGNGDSSALWLTTIWRFESNGYDAKLLSAIDFTRPVARSLDDKPQENRSSTADQLAQLGAAVDAVLRATGQQKLVLIGSSRGGNAIRNYVKNGGGSSTVAIAILCGTPNHGVFARPEPAMGEFNGGGVFLQGLNAGSEVVPGVAFVTLRSDKNDKYAQPTGEFIGAPGQPTNVTDDGPALAGATNIVLPNLDHREVAFNPQAFREMWRAIMGGEPKTLDPAPEAQPVLDGMVSGWANGGPTNEALAGAEVEIFEVDPETGMRRGEAAHRQTAGADGHWGPFAAKPDAYYEFVVAAAGYPTTHVYRTPFPRSSRYVQLRLQPADIKDKSAAAAVTLTRPRGYLGVGRDNFTIDGAVPEGVPAGVPSVAAATKTYADAAPRSVAVVLNREHMTVRTWPLAENHVVYAEFHY